MKELIKKLNYFSLIRILIGAAGVVYGIYNNIFILVILGIFLVTMALLNPSCYCGNKCAIKDKKGETSFEKNIDKPAKED